MYCMLECVFKHHMEVKIRIKLVQSDDFFAEAQFEYICIVTD